MVSVPDSNPNIPQDMYVSNLTMPKIQMRIDQESRSRIADPNVELYIAWFNEIKKIKLEYKARTDKFEATTQFTRLLGNNFYIGFNINLVKDRFVCCEFSHDPEPVQNEEEADCPPPKRQPPTLTVMNMKF